MQSKFIVITRSRTGSNLLMRLMDAHPKINAFKELFGKLNGKTTKELLALKNNIRFQNVIEVANPNKFPKLYDPKYRFDIVHLNKDGAIIFSELVAKELINLLNEPREVNK